MLLFSGHFFLLDLVVDDMAGCQFLMDVLQGDALLDHQHHHMVGKIRDLVDGLRPVMVLGGDDHLGALLAHLFQDLVDALLEQVGGVRTLCMKVINATVVKGNVSIGDTLIENILGTGVDIIATSKEV